MTELLVAGLCSATVWIGLRSLGRREPVPVARIGALAQGVDPTIHRRCITTSLMRWLGKRFPTRNQALQAELNAAGWENGDAESVRGAQIFGVFTGSLIGLVTGPAAMLLTPLGAVVGYRLPRMILSSRARKRSEEVARSLPDMVDLMAVCTQAGLNVALSLKRVADRTTGLVGQELRRTLEEIELGVPRPQALEGLAKRVRSEDLDALVAVLIGSERFGTQVSAALENFSREVRGRRRRRAEEQARRAPVKILFPLVFLILPAFILLTVVPLLLGTFSSLDL